MNKFIELGLSVPLAKKAHIHGWHEPTVIQQKTLPAILQGRDLLAIAQTGSGKTGAFLLPILDSVGKKPALQSPAALILAPTRELALQLFQNVEIFAPSLSLSGALLIGGVSILKQKEKLMDRPEIIVATPGRLLDHVKQKSVDLSGVRYLVLDEADRMLDMGFLPDIRKILSFCPTKRQSLLFSATLSDEIHLLAQKLLSKPVLVEINANRDVASIRQVVYRVPESEKPRFLRDLIVDNALEQVLVFTRQKRTAAFLADSLKKDGFTVDALHGDKTQAARLKIFQSFKDRRLRVLVATDLASRGLDIKELPVVVNYDLPLDPHDYIHRIGRTGRAGADGLAYSFASEKDGYRLSAIEKLLKKKLQVVTPEAFEDFFETIDEKKKLKECSAQPLKDKKSALKSRRVPIQRFDKANNKAKEKRDRKPSRGKDSFDYILPEFE